MGKALAVLFVLVAWAFAHGAQTNGTGGGNWKEGKTWAEGRLPRPEEPVVVQPGDTLLIEGKEAKRCAGLTISEGGAVVFGPIGGRLICAGDVDVKGSLSMGAESELQIDSPANMQHGIYVRASGALLARGSHPFARNCAIGAAKQDGNHNTFIRFELNSKGSLRFCELSYLGGRPPKDAREKFSYGILFQGGVVLEGCHIHHCYEGVHIIAGGALTVAHNLFTENATAMTLYRPTGAVAFGNHFLQNGVGLSVSGKHTEAACEVHGNLFERNKIGLRVWGLLARSSFHGNTYIYNDIGLSLASANAPIAEECFVGNRVAVELAPNTLGARLQNVVFGLFQGELIQNKETDVWVAAPGPSGIILDSCKFDLKEPVGFAPEMKDKPGGERWVISRNHNCVPNETKRWDTKKSEPGAKP